MKMDKYLYLCSILEQIYYKQVYCIVCIYLQTVLKHYTNLNSHLFHSNFELDKLWGILELHSDIYMNSLMTNLINTK